VLARARARLVAAGIPEPEAAVDVDLYARTILGWDKAQLLLLQQAHVPEPLEPMFSNWIERRLNREPSAYIVGHREFWGRDFIVTPAVLIPRPETEFIVDEAIAHLRGIPGPRAADIGTGSGCIVISVALDVPGATFVATDVSREALDVARANADRHAVTDRIQFVPTSYLDGVEGGFNVITANPPYVKDRDKPALARDVRHEPEVALFGGIEGLRDITGVLEAAGTALLPGGWLVMEFGYGQQPEIEVLVQSRPALYLERVCADLQGIPRTAIIQRR
jgi:release factor glutamine methyltransferase